MQSFKNKVTLLNIITSIILQLVTILSGFIIPKLILSYFGSDVNGLVSSINQLLNYITLVEGGLSSVVLAQLYKPIVEKDDEKLSRLMVTSRDFFRKIGFIFIVYLFVLAVVYPTFINNTFGFWYTFSLTIVLSISLLTQYLFSVSLRILLNADKKNYILSITQICIITANICLAILSVKIYPSIHLFKILTSILFLLQPVVYSIYIKKHYNINWNVKADKSLIKSRWDGFVINIASFIHGSTDITVLTLFVDLKSVSVYSVYALVSKSLSSLINSCINVISVNVGHAYAKNDVEDSNRKMNVQEYLTFTLTTFFFVVATILITPFVSLYTKGSTDANYYQPVFGILLLLSEAIYLINLPNIGLANAANKFKEMKFPAFIEAFINIAVSIAMVKNWGLIGVAIGTICGMSFRLIYQTILSSKILKDRKILYFFKKLIIFGSIFVIVGLLSNIMNICNPYLNVISWIIDAIVFSLITIFLLAIISVIFFRNELFFFVDYLRKKK